MYLREKRIERLTISTIRKNGTYDKSYDANSNGTINTIRRNEIYDTFYDASICQYNIENRWNEYNIEYWKIWWVVHIPWLCSSEPLWRDV